MTIKSEVLRVSDAVSNTYDRQANARVTYRIYDDAGGSVGGYQGIIASKLLPPFGTRYAGTSAVCVRYEAEPEPKNRSVWYVTVFFETKNAPDVDKFDDPVTQPAHVWYSVHKENVVAELAYQSGDDRGSPSKEVVNTAGDRFNPMPTEEDHSLVIVIEKNYRDFDPGDIAFYQNTINAGEITIGGVKFKAKEAWMSKVAHALKHDDNGSPYDRLHFEIIRKKGGWISKVPSNGFRYLSGGKLKKIREKDISDTTGTRGEDPISSPYGLKSDGSVSENPPNDVAILEFQLKFAEDWSKLSLPVRKDGSQ